MQLPLIIGLFVSVFTGLAVAGEGPRSPARPGVTPDFSLPRIMHSPIPETHDKVYFPSGSSDLLPEAKIVLDRQVEILQQFRELLVEVIGFADIEEAPSASEKAQLGLKRAVAVKQCLIRNGVEGIRLTAIGRDSAPLIPRRVDENSLAAMRFVWTFAGER